MTRNTAVALSNELKIFCAQKIVEITARNIRKNQKLLCFFTRKSLGEHRLLLELSARRRTDSGKIGNPKLMIKNATDTDPLEHMRALVLKKNFLSPHLEH